MRRAALILISFLSPMVAHAGFFSERCGAAWEAISRFAIVPRAQKTADQLGLKGAEKAEFVERQKRLGFLDSKAKAAESAFEVARAILIAYEELLIEQADLPKQSVWQLAVKKGILERTGNTLADLTPDSLAGIELPSFLSVAEPPKSVPIAFFAAAHEADLARYRKLLSERFCDLPLDRTMAQMSEQEMAKAVTQADEQFKRIYRHGASFERDIEKAATFSDPAAQIQFNSRVLGTARQILANPLTPPSTKNALRDHLDFMDKYHLQPDRVFIEYVISLNGLVPAR